MSQTLVRHYLHAKRVVIDAGFAREIIWQEEADPSHVTAASFLEQAAWVVLSAGMAEHVVSQRFLDIGIALHQFDLEAIAADPECRQRLLCVFNHPQKIDAILTIAEFARGRGDDHIRDLIMTADQESLMTLPYIGPVTVLHLLKNLGMPSVKPDRHLVRLARRLDTEVDAMCTEIAEYFGELPAVVEIVLWRWSTLHGRCSECCDGLPHL
jgi:endonuclease III